MALSKAFFFLKKMKISFAFATLLVPKELFFKKNVLKNVFLKLPKVEEIIEFSDGPRHLSTIPFINNFHLFKIAELVINFCLKNFSN